DDRRRRDRGRRLLGLLDAVLVGALAMEHRLAAVEHLADEGLLQRSLQLLELRDVHGGDRPQHHEQAHQERDHVGVRQQPALVGAVVLSAPSSASAARGAHAASCSGSDSSPPGAGATAGAGPTPLPRFAGVTKVSSFSASTRGLSPAWIERIASCTIVRWLISSLDISFSLLAMGRKT